MNQLLLALAAHFVGDFAFQSSWMATEKSKGQEVNFYHAATYTATFILFSVGLSWLALLAVFVTHFIIDYFMSRKGINQHIWQDQILHLVVITVILGIK